MDFTFDNELARENARRVHELSRDLALIEKLRGPGIRDMAEAPLLEDWMIGNRMETALIGTVAGHPLLADGPVITSAIHYLDEQAGYARTFSRWYRLGRRES